MVKSDTVWEEWYVIFTDSELTHWLMPYLEPGFKHCYAIKLSEEGCFWIVVQPTSSATIVKIVPVSLYPHVRLLAGPDAVILPVRAKLDPDAYRGHFCWFTCTEVVKSLLGIKQFWCWTPWQLYKRLKYGQQAGKTVQNGQKRGEKV
jgi:hypothetical protein